MPSISGVLWHGADCCAREIIAPADEFFASGSVRLLMFGFCRGKRLADEKRRESFNCSGGGMVDAADLKSAE